MARLGKAIYEVVYILDDATTVTKGSRGAPSPLDLYLKRPKRAMFVVRYMPSKRAWRGYDLRVFPVVTTKGQLRLAANPAPAFETPDKDAAIMQALLGLA